MMMRVCVVCYEDNKTNVDRNVNLSKLLKSPEVELLIHNVPAPASNDSKVDMRLPTADFYLDCLPDKFSDQATGNGEESRWAQPESSRFVRLFAGQSQNQDEISVIILDDIQRKLQDSSNQPRLDVLCKARLKSHHREQNHFSVLVFASASSHFVLSIAERDLSPGDVPHPGHLKVEKLAIVKDPTYTTVIQRIANSIITRPNFVGLDGCFRVDISVNNVTATVTDIKIDLKPHIFYHQESLDDWMVSQLPGSHEALICLLLTHHQQKVKGLTTKQATVRAAFDAISPQIAAAFDCIAHVAVMRSLAFQFQWKGSILDVGCGQGVFGGLLNLYHKGVELYGTDMSEAMIKAPQIEQYYHSPIHVGPMEQTLISSPTTDHITCFSVFQYVTPMTFVAALSQMFLKARKSITFDIPEVDAEYARKLDATAKLWRPNDHLSSLERFGSPAGWKLTMYRHCLTYTEPNYEHDVYSRYIRYERVD